jgi:beta-galactosidase
MRHNKILIIIIFIFIHFTKNVYPVIPEKNSEYLINLNGKWKFKLANTEDQICKDFMHKTNSEWDNINVPGSWETQGFEEPLYGEHKKVWTQLAKKVGLYSKTFTIPNNFKNRKIILFMDGICFAYKVYVNGKFAGEFTSAFQGTQFDISKLVKKEKINTLSIEVRRDNKYILFDLNDSWSISGISRDVYIYGAAKTHISEFRHKQTFDNNYREANIHGFVTLETNENDKENRYIKNLQLKSDLYFKDKLISSKVTLIKNKKGYQFAPDQVEFNINIKNPKLWNAETPNLYQLNLTLISNKEVTHKLKYKIGLRHIEWKSGIFTINGKPIKIRGVCRHDIDPKTGRYLREETMLKDADLMKSANINAVRISHYNPNKRWLDICDSIGLYVISEVPLGPEKYVRHYANPDALGHMLARAYRTIEQGFNRASIIIWSVGNEHTASRSFTQTSRIVKLLDDSRPTLFGGNSHRRPGYLNGIPPYIDLSAPHYPHRHEIKKYAKLTNVPIVFTEYNHSLGRANGDLKGKWEEIEKFDNTTGGFIWHWCYQGLIRKTKGKIVKDPYKGEFAENYELSADQLIDKDYIIDSHRDKGCDGIIFGNREPHEDYWDTRKVYSQIKIEEQELTIENGQKSCSLTIKNRYDFQNLNKLKITYKLLKNGEANSKTKILNINLTPHKSKQISLQIPKSFQHDNNNYHIEFNVTDWNNRKIYEHVIKLKSIKFTKTNLEQEVNKNFIKTNFHETKNWKDIDQKCLSEIINSSIEINKKNTIILNSYIGEPLLIIGRKKTITEQNHKYYNSKLWNPIYLTNYKLHKSSYQTTKTGISIYQKREYQSALKKEQKIILELICQFSKSKNTYIKYKISSENCKAYIFNIGVGFKTSKFKKINWLGKGPWASYPEKEDLANWGYHSIKAGDIYFGGNRKNVEQVEVMTNKSNFSIISEASNISWDNFYDFGIISHNSKVSGLGTKNRLPITTIKMENLGVIRGEFIIKY